MVGNQRISERKKIAIAGASGFVGRWLIELLHEDFEIYALSRKKAHETVRSNVQWITTDLYSLSETTQALEDIDTAIYLVHSMMPQTRLTQGSFEDMDLLLADNFNKAAAAQGVKHIIYIGGVIPDDSEDLSAHLASRLEVEEVFNRGAVPVTTLRASLVIGPGGSSFQLMKNLIKTLPIMVCPQWTQNYCQPIDIRELNKVIRQEIDQSRNTNYVMNVGGPESLTYLNLMKSTAEYLKLRRVWIQVSINGVKLSKWWVSKFSSTAYALVSPLIESLTHNMVIDKGNSNAYFGNITLGDSLDFAEKEQLPSIPVGTLKPEEKNTVRSVQRVVLKEGLSAFQAGLYYPQWLKKKSLGMINAPEEQPGVFAVKLAGYKILELTIVKERSDKDRMLFFVTGGALVKRKEHGWLEFRAVLGGKQLLIALHEFVPTIPWPFYRATQAILHLFVMRSFGQAIKNKIRL